MNWLHFLYWTAGLYTLYYLAVILLDNTRKGEVKTISNELSFSETVIPQKIEHLPDKPKEILSRIAPPIIASGGVSLKDLFGLCREEAIVYTKSVSF
jgi:hypothetical protein